MGIMILRRWDLSQEDFIVCIVPRSEEEIDVIPDFQDVEVRGRRYCMLSVVLGLPHRCHRCKVRGHLAYQCVACCYCVSGSHTSEEHSVENARRREFSAVVEGTQGIQDFETEDGEMEERGQVEEQLVNASQPRPVTQLINDMSEEEREGDGKEEDKDSGGEGGKGYVGDRGVRRGVGVREVRGGRG